MPEVGVLKPGIAIPTEFNGITYRSRLEANVAQFLVDIGLKFEYESKSFLVQGKHYAPDFYLPEMDRYVEARGYVTETSEATLEAFVRQQGDLFVFYYDKAEHVQYFSTDDEIVRMELAVALCDRFHASLGTLGYPSLREPHGTCYGCWLCDELKHENVKQPRPTYMEVVMRSGVPVMLTEVGKYSQRTAD